jgi:capsular polysaccharide biosynthesis protein
MWGAMAKKGKEIDLGGVRLQIDPFILLQRVLLRQKKMLTLVGIIGGMLTIWSYKTTDKIYSSSSSIAIRTETRAEDYWRKLANRAMRDVNSNAELMLITNELDLFGSTRASQPYEMALRRIRRELRIDRTTGAVSVGFESKDPRQARDVVAFVTERVLGTFANLIDSPYRREIQALRRGIFELQPAVQTARTKLFEFKAKHPSVAVRTPDFVAVGSPLGAIEADLKAAERNLKRCYAGAKAAPTPTRPTQRVMTGPACRRLGDLKRRKASLLAQYTPSHPEVTRIAREVVKQSGACDRESTELSGRRSTGGIKPGQTQGQCIDGAKARLAILHREKVNIQKKAIKKPKLQREWAELSETVRQLDSELRAMQGSRAQAIQNRLVAANDFQENFQLVDPPRVPELPTKPERNAFLMVGIAITAMLGLALATIRESLRQTFLDAEEFEEQTGLQVLAVLPDIDD